jgi:DNA-binding transcriptional MerR regulator
MQQYTISELARDFDITTRTIRYYEDMGLLAPTRNGQQRIYAASDKVKLKLVLLGKRLGFSLAESREIIELYDPTSGNKKQLQKLLNMINSRKESLTQQLDDIQIMMVELDSAAIRMQDALLK